MSNFVKATQAYQQGQRTLPGRYYTLAEIYAEERERIFTARWICVGCAADIPAAGDYLLRTIAGESVIVVRGRDGALRAFYNVCRHRGTRLCEEPRGRFSETIQCPYHAWTYTIDGQLISQNYSECLHCPVIHPGLAKLTPYPSGENDLIDGPFLGGYMVITKEGGSLPLSGRACAAPVGRLPAEDLNRVYFYSIFPNLLLSLHPDYVMFHTLWPDGPGRTRISCEWLFHPDSFRDGAFTPDDAVRFWDETNRQDWHICERSHAGIASRAYVPGPYSPREGISAAWDREFLRALGHAQ